MEQGSSSAKSPSSSSNQKRHSFIDELRAIVNSSSQDLSVERESRYSIPEPSEHRTSNFEGALNFSQSKKPQQTGPSFSRGPLQGEMLSQFDGANVDLSAAYLHGNLQSRDQQLYEAGQSFKSNNAIISGEEAHYDEMMTRYNLSLSNMLPPPPGFHFLPSSSAHPGVQIGSSQTLVPFESSIIASSRAQSIAMVAENLVSLRSMRSQGLPYPTNTPNGFHLGIGISNNAKSPTSSAPKAPFESSMNDPSIDVAAQNAYSAQQAQNNAATLESSFPIRLATTEGISYPMNTPSGFDLGNSSSGPASSALKRKMPMQDNIAPSWNSFGRGFHRYSSSSYNGGRYTLYDKRYEDVGLPVDPHLRIFIASNGNGNGESSSKSKD